MPSIFIFAIGAICTALCVVFYAIHFVEIRRINRQYAEREEQRARKIEFRPERQALLEDDLPIRAKPYSALRRRRRRHSMWPDLPGSAFTPTQALPGLPRERP